jgi:hypothetical protein
LSTPVQVTFDCANPSALAAFWAEALGYVVQPPPAGFESWHQALETWGVPEDMWEARSAAVDPDGDGPRLFFQQVPDAMHCQVVPYRHDPTRGAVLPAIAAARR